MNNNHKNSGIAGMGYYIALILCAAAIGVTGYWYYRSETQAAPASLQEPQEDFITPMASEDIPVVATIAPQPRRDDTSPSTVPVTPEEAVPGSPKKDLKTMSPVGGAEIFGYSMEALSYNQTTRDWRVHNGIDLAAEDGAPVVAAADGQVYTVYQDDTLGNTVVICHQDGYTTCYSSLGDDIPVKPGDTVTMGQVIGCAGSSAIVEATFGSHVHFSVTKNEEPMDPSEFLAIGE